MRGGVGQSGENRVNRGGSPGDRNENPGPVVRPFARRGRAMSGRPWRPADERGWHPLADGCPPRWACEWGEDRYGILVGFRVGRVKQRLRWIRPGVFWMGSPEGELGRWDDEGPQHEVTISRGYWLADTPVTQALWEAVMGENPSAFKGAERPVEQVSWKDCQRFCERLNERVPGLGVRLPSEAEWEYACRAKTQTATYAGDPDEDVIEAKVLEAIAWYSMNSGGDTHEVKQKQPNAWGLYDALGNVWEWCMDGMRQYSSDAQRDPMGPATGERRVSRGGSWSNVARSVRAACRYEDPLGDRDDDLGLRLVLDQAEPAK